MVNTCWTRGAYGTGNRMRLKYTRATRDAALEGKLKDVDYVQHPVFGLQMPTECPNVHSKVVTPRQTWSDENAYDNKDKTLANSFKQNFKKYEENANEEILSGGPIV